MFEEAIKKIGSALKRRRIAYMIIGGQAVLLYGEPRLTRDIDITLGAGIEGLHRMLEIAKELCLKPIPNDIEKFVKDTSVLPLIEESTGVRVDFIFSYTPYETQAIKRARKVKVLGIEVSFASPEDLIVHKIFSGRPRDIEDAKSVLLKNPNIDRKYIHRWLKEFEGASEKKRLLRIFEGILKEIR